MAKVWCAHTPHTTPYTTHYTIQQSHRPHRGSTQCPYMAGRPPGQQKKRGSCQTRTAGRFGGKKAAPPPPPLAADTPPQHDIDTCYDGDEEDHSSSRHSSSDSSDHGSCSSGSSGRIKYDGKSKRQARRRRKKRRDAEEKRGVRTLLEMWASPPPGSTPAPASTEVESKAGVWEVIFDGVLFCTVFELVLGRG